MSASSFRSTHIASPMHLSVLHPPPWILSLVMYTYVIAHAMQEATHDSKTYLRYYDVAKEVEVAKSLLKKAGVIEKTDDTGALSKRMAVMLLYRSAA